MRFNQNATIVVTLDQTCALLSDPGSEEAKVQNLLLNMMGGLTFENLSQEEQELLKKYGYEE